jgi:hypothetical protein
MSNISFIVEDEGVPNYVTYKNNITVEEFMKDYLSKHTNYVTLDTKVYTFKSNSKVLNSSKFLKKLLKDIIRANGRVILSRKQDTHYS